VNAIRRILTAGVSAVLLLQSVTAGAALTAYLKATGQKQGAFKGNSGLDTTADIVVKITHGLTSPAQYNQRRAAGGVSAMHDPISLTLKLDNATRSQWATALSGKEHLVSAEIVLVKPTSNGAPKVMETITLKNVAIEQLDFVTTPGPDEALSDSHDAANGAVYARVRFDFEQITITWTKGGITAGDDWTDPT
jgi:type VI secretion system Hcp family effector